MIIAIYITFFFIVLRFTVTLFNFISKPKLPRIKKQHHQLVSILIPARNEADNILNLLNSILAQDYENYEVIILDDDSEDDTFKICSDFADAHPRFSVIHGKDLPYDWLGKNYACYQLAEAAKGEYLLFLDADVQVYNDAINSSINRMHVFNLGLLSLFTKQLTISLGEKAVVPIINYVLLNILPLRLIYLVKNSAIASANGQFMFFEAANYRRNQWHEKVKDRVLEDIEIMKEVKAAGYNAEGLLDNAMVSCRMYKSYTEAINGFSKNFLAAFNYNIMMLLGYIVVQIGGPMIVMMTLDLPLILFMISLIVLSRILISLQSDQNVFMNVLLHPVQMVNLAVISFLAIHKYLTKTAVWKGRRV